MNGLKYTLSMIVAGGAAVLASDAAAATTVPLNIGWHGPITNIALIDGQAAQFSFGWLAQPSGKGSAKFKPLAGASVGAIVSNPGLPGPDDAFSTSYVMIVDDTAFDPFKKGPPVKVVLDQYVHLSFVTDGTRYLGSAYFDANSDLASITYETAPIPTPGGVPEPDAWALLIAGFGATGAVLRHRRRQPAVAR
jgi:hypothetical protein